MLSSRNSEILAEAKEAKGPILVVDDEPLVLRAFARVLTKEGFRVECASSGPDALRRAQQDYFPIMVTDLRMPGEDGLTLIERFQSTSPDTVFVIVTGLPDLDIRRHHEVDRSILSIVAKPWEESELIETLNRAWDVYGERLRGLSIHVEQTDILLVEDDPSDALLVQHQLGRVGSYRLHHVSRLEQAVRYLRDHSVDVILTDLSLPDARGLDAVLRLRQLAPEASLLALSGLDDEVIALQSVRLGAQDFCVKGQYGSGNGLHRAIRYSVERKHSERRLRHLADYDALTGLANRTTFRTRSQNAIARATRTMSVVGIGVVDLDHFKGINDTLGHDAGDAVLQAVAQRLSKSVREYDLVARLGGDEFAFLLEDLDGVSDGESAVERMVAALREPVALSDGCSVTPTASVGLALYPGAGDSVRQLLRAADAAMYAAKSEGRDGYQIHQGDVDSPVMQRFQLEGSLRAAVQTDAIDVVFQPQYELTSGELVAFEALARWTRPDGVACPPLQFVPVLETTGLIHEAGLRILRRACERLAAWRQTRPHLRMAVNVSPVQLERSLFVDELVNLLESFDIPPPQLELEITEGVLMRDTQATRATLASLGSLGVRIAVDDFGTGYSSLRYLQRFDVDVLKIDRAFVSDLHERHDSSIPAAVVALGDRLGIRVVAEGVETKEQLRRLCGFGCAYGQGYLLGAPAAEWDLASIGRLEQLPGLG